MNKNGWLAFNACREKIWKVTICKNRCFWKIPDTSVLPAVAKEFAR